MLDRIVSRHRVLVKHRRLAGTTHLGKSTPGDRRHPAVADRMEPKLKPKPLRLPWNVDAGVHRGRAARSFSLRSSSLQRGHHRRVSEAKYQWQRAPNLRCDGGYRPRRHRDRMRFADGKCTVRTPWTLV